MCRCPLLHSSGPLPVNPCILLPLPTLPSSIPPPTPTSPPAPPTPLPSPHPPTPIDPLTNTNSAQRTESQAHPAPYSHPHPHHHPHCHVLRRLPSPLPHLSLPPLLLRLARRLQREEESQASESVIRAGLTEQFARACGRPVEDVDLSQLSLSEAQEAIVIQLRISREKKKRGLLGGLRARFRAKKKPSTAASSSTHLSVQGGDRGRRSPSPSPPPHPDIDAMSYEELLALSEAIGDVKSKGLSEEDIARLPTAVFEKVRAEGEEEGKGEDEGEGEGVEGQVEGSGDGQRVQVKAKKKGWFFSRGKKAKAGKEGGKEEQKSPSAEPVPHPRPSSPQSPALDAAQWKDTCSICLTPFAQGDLIKFLPCFHHMHAEELDNWLMVNASCPICKEKPLLH